MDIPGGIRGFGSDESKSLRMNSQRTHHVTASVCQRPSVLPEADNPALPGKVVEGVAERGSIVSADMKFAGQFVLFHGPVVGSGQKSADTVLKGLRSAWHCVIVRVPAVDGESLTRVGGRRRDENPIRGKRDRPFCVDGRIG
jgi:hypothetical protein